MGNLLVVLLSSIFLMLPAPMESRQRKAGQECKNATRRVTYSIDGQHFRLKRGKSVIRTGAGKSSRIITSYSGKCASGDVNGDNRNDVAMVLYQETGGSGTFAWVVCATSNDKAYTGSDGYFLGDRISVESVRIIHGKIIIDYYTRSPGMPMSDPPLVQARKILTVNGKSLAETSETGKLTGTDWEWVTLTMNNGESAEPEEPGIFSLTFLDDGTFKGTTDCNSYYGKYSLSGEQLDIGSVGSTKKYCVGAREEIYLKFLKEVESYFFTGDGRLVLQLKYDSGSLVFKKR